MPTDFLSEVTGLSLSSLEKATALPADVISGKTFYSGDKELKTGTFNLSAATATAADVLSGKTFYAGNNTLKTGTLNLGSKVSIIEITAPPVGNEYREGDASYNTGRQILWCKTQVYGAYGDNYWNTITVNSYSNGVIYYHWRVHNNGARAYVPVIFA